MLISLARSLARRTGSRIVNNTRQREAGRGSQRLAVIAAVQPQQQKQQHMAHSSGTMNGAATMLLEAKEDAYGVCVGP